MSPGFTACTRAWWKCSSYEPAGRSRLMTPIMPVLRAIERALISRGFIAPSVPLKSLVASCQIQDKSFHQFAFVTIKGSYFPRLEALVRAKCRHLVLHEGYRHRLAHVRKHNHAVAVGLARAL